MRIPAAFRRLLRHAGLTVPAVSRPARTRKAKEPPQQAVDLPVPAGGAFINGRWGGAGTTGRDYKLYVPPQAGTRPLPLVVMLHGCTQDPADFATGTRMNEAAREMGLFVLYPAQSRDANPHRCWNWFKHTHQTRERGEPRLIAGMVRQVMRQYAVDADRVWVAGLSAGGAMAAILGQTHPDLFAAVGVHSGLGAGAARSVLGALHAMTHGAAETGARGNGMPTIVFHGDADRTVHPDNAVRIIAATVGPAAHPSGTAVETGAQHRATRRIWRDPAGQVVAEHWEIHGGSHGWSGGNAWGTHTDPHGPDATAQMLRFFLEHPRKG